jgi:hypothetical protein
MSCVCVSLSIRSSGGACAAVAAHSWLLGTSLTENTYIFE